MLSMLPVLLSLSAIGLAGQLYNSLPSNENAIPEVKIATIDAHMQPNEQEEIALTVDVRPISTFSGIVDRPLFSNRRRPPSPTVQKRPVVPEPKIEPIKPAKQITTGTFRLMGVISTDDKEVALLQETTAKGKIHHPSEGEVVSGWTVKSIEASEVLLVQDGVQDRISLRDNVLSEAEKRRLTQKMQSSKAQKLKQKQLEQSKKRRRSKELALRRPTSNQRQRPSTSIHASPRQSQLRAMR